MNNKLYKLMNWPRIEGIVYSEEANPQEILGVHTTGKNVLAWGSEGKCTFYGREAF